MKVYSKYRRVSMCIGVGKREAKVVVSKMKTSKYEILYNKLNTKEWKNQVYRLDKQKEEKPIV